MPALPRIYQAVPVGPVTHAEVPIPVVVTMRWKTFEPTEVTCVALAWTRTEVEVEWTFQGELRRDWLPAGDVRRTGQPPHTPPAGPAADLTFPLTGTRHPRRY